MSTFSITAKRPDGINDDDVRHIRITAGDDVLTRLVRNFCEEDDTFHAPATPLAFWLVDNWWRIRCEPVPFAGPDTSWHLAHELSAIGGGYMWPRIAFWGEGERVGSYVHQDPLPTPIQFLARGIRYVSAAVVESGADQFLRQLLTEPIDDKAALRTLYDGIRQWRKVEAMLGYDVDEAPHGLMNALDGQIAHYGETSVEEAILARPGEQAADALQTAVAAASAASIRARLPVPIENVACDRDQSIPPWAIAAQSAASLRAELSLSGPVCNRALGDILGVPSRAFKNGADPALPYGLRVREDASDHSRLALHATRPQARRFELCRHMADIIWSENGHLGPVSDALSARQKFQRAFAQNFLCPYPDVLDYCGTAPTPDDIAAAATHFHVSERSVAAVLGNNGHGKEDSFLEMVGSA